jgi:autotransporter-associated beta strand protein
VQNSGTVQTAPGVSAESLNIGMNATGYGYYRMNGGKHETGHFAVGKGATVNGVLDMFDGEMSATFGWFLTAWGGGNGIINLYGGKLGSYPAGNNGVNVPDAGAGVSAFSMINVLGAGAHLDFGQVGVGVEMSKAAGYALSAINLNAGTMTAQRIYASAGSPAFLNFNGGALKASVSGTLLNGSLTAATVYDGGAVIDTDVHDVTFMQPLRAPTDYGVSAVAMNNAGSSYMGPPIVKLNGGSGTGALAIATINFDTDSASYGKLTGFTVTAPGTGYQAGETLTAQIISGGGTTAATAGTVTLAPHAQTGGLTKRGTGTLTLAAPNTYTGVTHIEEGTLRVTPFTFGPGLYEGSVPNPTQEDNASGRINLAAPNPKTGIQSSPRMGNTNQNWPNYTTYIYTGYVWNRSTTNETWTFAKSFDDAIYLVIDNTVVLNNTTWNQVVRANYTLTPGPHRFEVRFGQGGGGVGPVNQSWWSRSDIGFGYDPLGGTADIASNYLPMIDPGNGTLFTLAASPDDTTISNSSGIIVDEGATLDLMGGTIALQNVEGEGTVINGTAVLSGALMPGGDGNIGTLTFYTSLTGDAAYHVDVLPDGTSDLVVVNGSVNLSQMTLHVVDPELLSRGKPHVILTTTGVLMGEFADHNLPSGLWQIRYESYRVRITPLGGTILMIR